MSTTDHNASQAQGPAGNLEIDLAYDAVEDRLRLSLRGSRPQTDWFLTRRLTLRLLQAWLGKLEEVPLPNLPVAPWMPNLGPRELAQEHALSMEFDGPRLNPQAPRNAAAPFLVETLNLTVSSTECGLNLVAPQASTRLTFTRRESHAMLEAVAKKARQGGWLDGLALPEWLGQGGSKP